VKPRRRSVAPAAIQICVLDGGAIIAADTPTKHAPSPNRRYLLCSHAHDSVGCESFPSRSNQVRAMERSTLANSGLTLTGNSFGLVATQSPRLIQLPSVENQVGINPCVRATSATDAPSAKLSSTIRRFSSNARCRRLRVTASVYVSIFAPSGHYRLCPLREHDSPLHACPDGQCRTLTSRLYCSTLLSVEFGSEPSPNNVH